MNDATRAADEGDALLELRRPAQAEQRFREALAADPNDPDLLVGLARALLAQERFAEAQDAAERALVADPEELTALLVLSAALAGLERFDAAAAAVSTGLRLAPEAPQFHRQLGLLLLAQDRPYDALSALEHARGLDPQDADTLAAIGFALLDARRPAEAEQAAADALRIEPGNPEAHRLRSRLALRQGRSRDAVASQQSALRADPADPDYRHELALAMKARNPLYGLLLRYSLWLDGLGAARWAFILAPIVLIRVLRPFEGALWAQVLLAVVVGFVVLSWALEPVMNLVLMSSAYGRNLLPSESRRSAFLFLAYLVGIVGAVTLWLAADVEQGALLAIAMAIWAMSAGSTHEVSAPRRTFAWRVQAVAGVVVIATTVAAVVGASGVALPLLVALWVFGVVMLWTTSLL